MLRFIPRQARPLDGRAAAALRPYEGVTARLLYARGITDAAQADAFLNPSLDRLHDPLRMHGMAEALDILTDARRKGLAVAVYGDYDVDGICACALMTQALRRFGLRADPHTPLREEGYGLNLAAVNQLAKDYRVLVTVDLGITNHEEVRLAQRLGMRVIVTDHHGLGLEASPADAALNPLLGDYPFRRLCGTGVAFKLAQALLGLDACRDYLDLAALATVADIVPLEDENRILVSLGLKAIAGRKRAGMRALLRVSGDPDPVDSEALGYRLGPRLNAAGRLDDAGKGVRLMMTDDPAEADRLAEELDALNTERRAAEQQLVKAAQAQAAGHDFIGEKALIVRGRDWHVGVIGLAAGRLCQQYYCPTCVLSEHEGLLHGSLRSIPGVHIHECLKTCDDLLLRYGGHEQAAGVTLEADRYEAFCERLQSAVGRAEESCFVPVQPYDAELTLSDCTDALLDEISRMAPFGCWQPRAPVSGARAAAGGTPGRGRGGRAPQAHAPAGRAHAGRHRLFAGRAGRDASGRGGRGVQPGAQHLPWGDVAAAGRQGAQARARGVCTGAGGTRRPGGAGCAGDCSGRRVFHAGRKNPFGYRIHTGSRLARAGSRAPGGAARASAGGAHACLGPPGAGPGRHGRMRPSPGRPPRLCDAAHRAGIAADRGALAARMAAGRRGVSG